MVSGGLRAHHRSLLQSLRHNQFTGHLSPPPCLSHLPLLHLMPRQHVVQLTPLSHISLVHNMRCSALFF